ncbi:MAG: helix-turn-helix transcriptional regulator [Candidatus Eisenbacteria bacterium]|nr:helix-turn-helix transcriptional regulator [Candidatus Eisenbacteria bacterium]
MDLKELEIQNLTRQCNETLILFILVDGDKHGYQLSLEIEERSGGLFRFNHGTLYPILHKLEKEGWIRGNWRKEDSKRKRRSYALTDRGRKHAVAQREAWRRFFGTFFSIVGEVDP